MVNQSNVSMSSELALVTLIVTLACLIPTNSFQDEVTTTTNQKVNINNNQETIKWGNHKIKNYNFQESNYQPTQVTQLVLNIPKLNKLRAARPPTVEEYAIKNKILSVFEAAKRDFGNQSIYLDHLGRIIKALNPKYIATDRVMRVAFADPADPDIRVVPPESELPPPTAEHQKPVDNVQVSTGPGVSFQPAPLELNGDDEESITKQLDMLKDKFSEIVVWDKRFARKLTRIDDNQFEPSQVAFKRLIQCLAYPLFCYKPTKSYAGSKGSMKMEDTIIQEPIIEESIIQEPIIQEPVLEFKPPGVTSSDASGREYSPSTTNDESRRDDNMPLQADDLRQYNRIRQEPVTKSTDQLHLPHQQEQQVMEEPFPEGENYGSGYKSPVIDRTSQPMTPLKKQHYYQPNFDDPVSKYPQRSSRPLNFIPNRDISNGPAQRYAPRYMGRILPGRRMPGSDFSHRLRFPSKSKPTQPGDYFGMRQY